jgi:endonuclease YncB( thermonuclease family)
VCSSARLRQAGRGAAAALLLLLWLPAEPAVAPTASPQPATRWQARVAYVIDGDTLILADRRHVRLIGINAPELGKDGAPDQPLSRAARAALERLVGDQTVELVLGHETYDRYGRLLAHVDLADGRSVQELLLSLGLAVRVAIPPNLERQPAYAAAEQAAHADKRGIWGMAYYEPVPAERLRASDSGFRFVVGRIEDVWRSKKNVHLVMTPRLHLLVPLQDLHYFDHKPESLVGQRLIARGWITHYGGKLQLRVRHPSMLSLLQ